MWNKKTRSRIVAMLAEQFNNDKSKDDKIKVLPIYICTHAFSYRKSIYLDMHSAVCW